MEIERIEPKYYNDISTDGIIIDWKEIFSFYNELGCPENVYNPTELPIDDAAWFVLTSERNTGKTTNLILITMILFLRYGCISAYLRQKSDMITPKEMANFMNVILANHYIEKLTNGEYNGVRYWARHYRFVKWDEDGKKAAESDPFLWVGALSENLNYKSVLNLPKCNMIIYDEFISADMLPNEFVTMCDLHKTIGRNRLGIKLMLCANTTNYYHEFFRELLIQEEVLNCKVNNSFIKTTPLGTRVYYKMIGDKNTKREKVNIQYYGFNNPRLKSITGGDWAVNSYPHIQREEREEVLKNFYIYFNERYFQLELVKNSRLGMHVLVHRANTPKMERVRIYTIEEIRNKFEAFRFGNRTIDFYFWDLRKRNLWFYADNDVGFSVESYVNRAVKL